VIDGRSSDARAAAMRPVTAPGATAQDSGNGLHALAAGLLAALDAIFASASGALARACARSGKLDPNLLDAHQVSCYELAWVRADLLAATTLLDATAPAPLRAEVAGATQPSSEVDQQLALVFCVDALGASLPRLEQIFIEQGLDVAPLHALHVSPQWAELRQAAGGAAALAAAGRGVIAAGGDIARVELSEPIVLAREAFRRFGRERHDPLAASIHRDDLTVPESLLQPLREMGVFGLSIPQRYGGTAPDAHDDALLMVVVTEALSEASLGAAGSLITRPEILSRALLAGGTEAQRQHWLPRLASGELLCAIAMTEPDFGSDVASLALKATPAPGGWCLNGAKTWCTFAGKAGVLMVVARTDSDASLGHRGLSLLLVEKPSTDASHFEHRPTEGGRLSGRAIPTIGYRGMHSFDLSFEDLFVPDSNVIGQRAGLGQGFYFTMAGMVGGRMQTAARACGVMWAAFKAALSHSADRKVFGAPLNSVPLTQAKLARMAARLAACRQLSYAVARRMDHDSDSGNAGSSDSARVDASLAKLLACRSAEWVTREAQQLHGGMGYAEETAVSRYFVDARVLSIFEGAEETLALKVIARSLLEAASSRAAGPTA
jgi:(2S)-methylsuccinyl-CoA dehydrogenase